MALDKEFFSLVGPTLIEQGECVAMIAHDKKYYAAKGPVPAKTDAFSPLIDMIEWLNIKNAGTSKSAVLTGKPIYYIGWELAEHESTLARQNNWTLDKLGNKKLQPKDEERLETRIYREGATREDVPSRALSGTLATFKLAPLAPGPAVSLTDQLQKLYMLAAFSVASEKAKDRGRVTAILTGAAGEIWSYGIKSDENAILHAEVTTIQNLFINEPAKAQRLKTDQTYLFTTLKPCGMCAAMIAACGAGKIHVVYGQNDSGEEAAHTCLDGKAGMHHQLAQDMKLKDPDQKKLINELQVCRTNFPGGPIVHLLDNTESRNLMRLAHARTVHKVGKYASAQEDSGKKKVMAHLASFLRSIEVIQA